MSTGKKCVEIECTYEFARGGKVLVEDHVHVHPNGESKGFPGGPPMYAAPKYHGTGAVGLCLSRYHEENVGKGFADPDSLTRQTAYDFDRIQDREYDFLSATNDDGWLVGGGESSQRNKLPSVDSAHITLCEPGTFQTAWGGCDLEKLRT